MLIIQHIRCSITWSTAFCGPNRRATASCPAKFNHQVWTTLHIFQSVSCIGDNCVWQQSVLKVDNSRQGTKVIFWTHSAYELIDLQFVFTSWNIWQKPVYTFKVTKGVISRQRSQYPLDTECQHEIHENRKSHTLRDPSCGPESLDIGNIDGQPSGQKPQDTTYMYDDARLL